MEEEESIKRLIRSLKNNLYQVENQLNLLLQLSGMDVIIVILETCFQLRRYGLDDFADYVVVGFNPLATHVLLEGILRLCVQYHADGAAFNVSSSESPIDQPLGTLDTIDLLLESVWEFHYEYLYELKCLLLP